ncbi:MAG: biotin--[acetyl-CoA-carboxylase] ligase [Planctomycetes bacterium]|nr:biotin--[acetyl-CoA-carboxylase] ligase [Planctomycetota bacterium]
MARERAQKGGADGTLVTAEEQTAGKGRQGRRWFSPKGTGIYMSIILRSPFHTRRPEILSLLGAFTTATAIRAEADVQAEMKWPNDVMINGKKVAGVLGESGHGGGPPYVILGIGVNVNITEEEFPPALKGTATSIRIECGREISRAALIASILDRFEEFYLRTEPEALTDLVMAIKPLCSSLDQRVRVKQERELLVGRAVDIDATGALIVETPDGRQHRLLGGEVTIL